MPLINSPYRAPHLFKNGYFSTVYSGLVRQVSGVEQERERLVLPDGDFIDIDWMKASKPSNTLVVLLHGLEGDTKRPYMLGSAKIFNQNGIDTVGVNFRGCSGEFNKAFRSYHSGETEDLHQILLHILANHSYDNIVLRGISLGGNVLLKYLGEDRDRPKEVKMGLAVSAPCDLYGSMLELHQWYNRPYEIYFKRYLIERLKHKRTLFPERIQKADIQRIHRLRDFDDVYTAPAHGFDSGMHYYKASSSLPYIENIRVPALLLNAQNDSFLSASCTPLELAERSKSFFVEYPKHGGHVGFHLNDPFYYDEKCSLTFVKEHLKTNL